MDIKRLEIFLKILETKSLSKTATAFGMAQPSVSASLKTLEDSIGYKLFQRSPRSVKPLPQALVLAPYARSVLETLNEATWALTSQNGGPKESLVVGSSSLPALVIIPEALRVFKTAYPNIQVKLQAGGSENIIQRVRDGEFDIGLVGLPHVLPELSKEVIAHDHLCLLASDDVYARVGRPPRSIEEVTTWPLLMREDGSGTKASFLKGFAKRPALLSQLIIAAEVVGLLQAVTLARAGLGAAVVSSLTERAPWLVAGMRLLPLHFLGSGRHFYLIRRKSRMPSPVVKEFIRVIKNLPNETPHGQQD